MTRETIRETSRESEIEQALARTVRSSLDRFQLAAEELQQAVNDLAAACSSARVANTLPPMMRAQMSAASLAASLEALSRLVTSNLPTTLSFAAAPTLAPFLAPAPAVESETAPEASESPAAQIVRAPGPAVPSAEAPGHQASELAAAPLASEVATAPSAEESVATPEAWRAEMLPGVAAAPVEVLPATPEMAPDVAPVDLDIAAQAVPEQAPETVALVTASELLMAQEGVSAEVEEDLAGAVAFTDFAAALDRAEKREDVAPEDIAPEPLVGSGEFNIAGLPVEVQELHRRANRVAKVSMQDIKLLRPEDVRLGQQHRDLCFRLREDLERAHKEYDRRFQTILDHPVDYFYDWLVEILADGDPQLLGEYPYPSPALRR